MFKVIFEQFDNLEAFFENHGGYGLLKFEVECWLPFSPYAGIVVEAGCFEISCERVTWNAMKNCFTIIPGENSGIFQSPLEESEVKSDIAAAGWKIIAWDFKPRPRE